MRCTHTRAHTHTNTHTHMCKISHSTKTSHLVSHLSLKIQNGNMDLERPWWFLLSWSPTGSRLTDSDIVIGWSVWKNPLWLSAYILLGSQVVQRTEQGLCSQAACTWLVARIPRINCLTLVLQFPHLSNGDKTLSLSQLLWGLTGLIGAKYQVHNKRTTSAP